MERSISVRLSARVERATRPDTAGRSSAWDALCAGFALSLATPATYRQRCRAIDDARDDALRKIERESQPARPELRSKPTISVLQDRGRRTLLRHRDRHRGCVCLVSGGDRVRRKHDTVI